LAALWFWLLAQARAPAPARRRALAVVTLLGFALAVRLAGVDHEIEERSYLDEGTYYQNAIEINGGKLIEDTFVYPHLLYYADALVLWTVDLHPAFDRFGEWLGGKDEYLAKRWLYLRLLVALLSALTTAAVFAIGYRVVSSGGSQREHDLPSTRSLDDPALVAGILGALLYSFSPLFNEGSHLIISDFPAACLATFALVFVVRTIERERALDYALAGLFAGLAAATKYPAGIVAVAIPAVWLLHRFRARSLGLRTIPPLALATASALAVFVAVMPGLVLFPAHAIFGRRGMLFGLRQYSGGGWLGVMPDSNLLFYLGELRASFGLLALVALALAPFAARGEVRRRWLWLVSFPVLYLALIVSMNMVVKRNLAPVLPVLAALAGVGAWACFERLAARWPKGSRASRLRLLAGAVLGALLLYSPVRTTIQNAIAFARPSTLELADLWIDAHLPRGASILKEQYSPRLDWTRYRLRQERFAVRVPLEEMRSGDYDYLLLASKAYGRYVWTPLDAAEAPHHHELAERYRTIFDDWERVAVFAPGPLRHGSQLDLFRIPLERAIATPATLDAGAALVADLAMIEGATVRFSAPGQWASFRAPLAKGAYTVRWLGERAPGESTVRVETAVGEALTTSGADHEVGFELPADSTVLLGFELPPGSTVEQVTIGSR
jgi:hypothetical protein